MESGGQLFDERFDRRGVRFDQSIWVSPMSHVLNQEVGMGKTDREPGQTKQGPFDRQATRPTKLVEEENAIHASADPTTEPDP